MWLPQKRTEFFRQAFAAVLYAENSPKVFEALFPT